MIWDAEYVCVRFDKGEIQPPEGWIQEPIYATYCADLNSNAKSALSAYTSDHRNHIRKALRKGFSVQFGQLDLLEDSV